MLTQPPRLDDLTYEVVRQQLMARLAVVAPEWTDHNPSDPGVAMVELFAWLADQLSYRLKQVPDLHHAALLQLLGARQLPAAAATTRLALLLGPDLGAARDTVVGPGQEAQAAGAASIKLEVDTPVQLIPAELTTILTGRTADIRDLAPGVLSDLLGIGPEIPLFADPASWADRQLHMVWDGRLPVPAVQLPARPVTIGGGGRYRDHDFLYLGFRQLPEAFPGRRVSLTIQLDADDEPATGLTVTHGDAADVQEAGLPWSYYRPAAAGSDDTGTWEPLEVIADTTRGLTRSGTVVFQVPNLLGSIPTDEWQRIRDWPRELFEALALGTTTVTVDVNAVLGAGGSSLTEAVQQVLNATQAGTGTVQVNLDLLNLFPKVPHPLPDLYPQLAQATNAWFRVGQENAPLPTVGIRHIGFNVVTARATKTYLNEVVTTAASGRPGQTYRLSARDVLDGTLALVTLEPITGGTTAVSWERVEHLVLAGADDNVYALDPSSGEIWFGDGTHGRVPPRGAQLVATSYRAGGGRLQELDEAQVTVRGTLPPAVAGVTNIVDVRGGRAAETLDDVRARLPVDLRTQRRAVTADDYVTWTLRTPTATFARAHVLANRRPYPDGAPDGPGVQLDCEAPGAVTVLPIPARGEDAPRPSVTECRALAAWLDPVRLLTTEVHITAPLYVRLFDFRLTVTPEAGVDADELRRQLTKRILTWFDPRTGGRDGTGLPFGGSLTAAGLASIAYEVPAVRDVILATARFDSNAVGPTGALESVGRRERAVAGTLVQRPTTSGEVDRVDLRRDEIFFADIRGLFIEVAQ